MVMGFIMTKRPPPRPLRGGRKILDLRSKSLDFAGGAGPILSLCSLPRGVVKGVLEAAQVSAAVAEDEVELEHQGEHLNRDGWMAAVGLYALDEGLP